MEPLSFQEKKSLANLFSVLLVIGWFVWYVWYRHPAELSGEVDFAFWGKTMLWLMPLQIGASILIHILLVILNTIATREEDPGIEDERDKMVDMRAGQFTLSIFALGFVLSMIPLALGYSPVWMFVGLAGGLFLSQITWCLTQFYLYRRGY
ncbi:MAG: DUF2178 domain-containing protein [Bacteroidota bacterium]